MTVDLLENFPQLANSEEANSHVEQDAESLNEKGIRLAKLGQTTNALQQFRRAVELDPNYRQSYHNLGVALAETGDLTQALESFESAVRGHDDYAEGHCGMGNTLLAMRRHDEASESYRKALAARPDHAGALNGLGLALTARKRPAEAAIVLRQAVRFQPESATAYNNLGLALNDEGRYDEAEAAFTYALRIDPRYGEAHSNLANTFKEQGRLAEALICYDLALLEKPKSATTHWNRSLALLQSGDYSRGWPEYEWRWAKRDATRREFSQPLWDGSSLAGRTVLVLMEQGLGDVVMFIRYVRLLKETGARVIAEYPAPLARILPTCPGVDEWIAEGAPLPDFDCRVSVMSLPSLFKTKLESIPADIPYLFADPKRIKHWTKVLKASPCFKVGIAWQGNPNHAWDRHRSVSLGEFTPLGQIPNLQLISLQRGPGTEQTATFGKALELKELIDPSLEDAQAVSEIAALMKALDLVVTVDTSTAHLAGALGVPVWVALSTMVDWRWMMNRQDTPWYPTMRLFRQSKRDEWRAVFDQITGALREHLPSEKPSKLP